MKPEKEKKILEDSIDWLSKQGTEPDEFKIWLKSFLITNISDPLPDFSFTEYPHEYLFRIYEATSNVRFQERLRCAVKWLFKDWNVNAKNTESIEYYSSLLNLIAELPVSEMYPELIETALSGYYCGTISKNEKRDIQALTLQVIAGMPAPGVGELKDRLLELVKKYIHDIRYTPLCFRIAWQTRYEYAAQYIGPLLKCSDKKDFDIHGTIERFLRRAKIDTFKELFIPMMKQLQVNNLRKYFLGILSDLGVDIRVSNYRSEPDHILMSWKVYDQPVVPQTNIYCGEEHYDIMNSIEEFPPLRISVEKGDEEFQEFVEEFLEKAA